MKTISTLLLGALVILSAGCPKDKYDSSSEGANRGTPVEHEPARNPAPLNTHDEKAGQERTEGKDLENAADAAH